MTTLIVGSGGNGHSYFIEFLLKNKIKTNCMNDLDSLKHLSHPKEKILKSKNITKCIFIYNNPFLSILSHFRRNWQLLQIKKLGNPYKLNKKNVTNLDIFFELFSVSKPSPVT